MQTEMNAYRLDLKDRLRSSFWLVPAVMTMLALALLAEGAPCRKAVEAIRQHGHLIHRAALAEDRDDADRQAIDERYAVLQEKLAVV